MADKAVHERSDHLADIHPFILMLLFLTCIDYLLLSARLETVIDLTILVAAQGASVDRDYPLYLDVDGLRSGLEIAALLEHLYYSLRSWYTRYAPIERSE